MAQIHINKQVVARNLKKGTNDPPIIIIDGSSKFHANNVLIEGPSEVRYWPDQPLKSGARVWIETFDSPYTVLYERGEQ